MTKSVATAFASAALALLLVGCSKSPVQEASEAIEAIGIVSLDSKSVIDEAQQRYDALSDEDREKVGNSGVLRQALDQYQELVVEKECFDLIDSSLATFRSRSKSAESFTAAAQLTRNAIIDEISALSSFDAGRISNGEFAQLFSEYKASLRSEVDGLSDFPDNAVSYNKNYIEKGVEAQAACLAAFESGFGLKSSNDVEVDGLGKMLIIGEPYVVETKSGNVSIAAGGFAIDWEETKKARQYDGFTESQCYGYLLCVLKNESIAPAEQSYDNYLNLESVVSVAGIDGVGLSSPGFSSSYPGYDIATGGYWEIPEIGKSKHVAVPYVVGSDESDVLVLFSSGEFAVLSVSGR